MNREQILETAKKTVCHDRNEQYGEPEDNFWRVAKLWSSYFGDALKRAITARDVANMMILFKIARNAAAPKDDNWIDIAGYAACGGEVDDGQSL